MMKLIENARQWWKLYSIHALAIASAIPAAFAMVPHTWQVAIEPYLPFAGVVVFVCGVVGRVVVQQSLTDKGDDNA